MPTDPFYFVILMVNRILFLVLSTVVVMAGMLCLHQFSRQILQQDNSFVRVFPPQRIGAYRGLDLRFNSYYLAGSDTQHIYLGNSSNPSLLLRTNFRLNDSTVFMFQLPYPSDSVPAGLQWVMKGKEAWLVNFFNGAILKGVSGSADLKDFASIKKFIYSELLPLAPNTAIVNLNDMINRRRVLARVNWVDTGCHFSAYYYPTQREEGWFSTSGSLCYDPMTESVVYVSHYSNHLICLDPNLYLKYNSHTIDTTNVGHLTLLMVPSTKTQSPDRPDQLVNASCSASNGWLFVHSRLRASNENTDSFLRNAVIDAYSIQDGRYHYSFYIPFIDGRMMKSFLVQYPYVVVLYERSIAVFDLFPRH